MNRRSNDRIGIDNPVYTRKTAKYYNWT